MTVFYKLSQCMLFRAEYFLLDGIASMRAKSENVVIDRSHYALCCIDGGCFGGCVDGGCFV